MNDLIMIMISYTLIIVLAFGIVAWLQAGFLMPFLKVKTSRGKKILCKIRKSTGTDFIPAEEIEGQLVFKYHKEKMRLSNYKNGLYRSWNLNCIDVDPETWGIVSTVDFKAISTNDPNKTDSLIERALLKLKTTTTKEAIVLFLLVLIGIGIIFIAYKLSFLQQLISGLGSVAGKNI